MEIGSSSTPIVNIASLLTSAFHDHNITVYGSWEEPYFKASEIGDMLEISQIRKTIQNIDEDFKVVLPGNSITGSREQYFLTL